VKGAALTSEVLTRQSVTPELALDGLDSVLGLHIGTTNTLFVSRLERQLEPLSVTPKQVAILWLVHANPGVKQTDLSRFFKIERPTVHQFVRQLMRNGYLVNEPSKLDRRAGGLWITESGQITLAEARRLIVAHEDELTACLTVREKSELFRILMKVYLSAPSKSELRRQGCSAPCQPPRGKTAKHDGWIRTAHPGDRHEDCSLAHCRAWRLGLALGLPERRWRPMAIRCTAARWRRAASPVTISTPAPRAWALAQGRDRAQSRLDAGLCLFRSDEEQRRDVDA
jgi:DNA-binding MarR family transcriptional regulator